MDPAPPRILRPISGGADALRLARAVVLIAGVREGRDPGHAERVAHLSQRLARALDLDPDTAHRCAVAGWLHDIGMVALPDAALAHADRAAGSDTPELRAHVLIGADLVRRVEELANTAPAIRHHHERWDGSGYPDGRAGTAIPVEARIVAVADVIAGLLPTAAADARARKAAASRLRSMSGSMADPAVVDAALLVLADEAAADGAYLRIA